MTKQTLSDFPNGEASNKLFQDKNGRIFKVVGFMPEPSYIIEYVEGSFPMSYGITSQAAREAIEVSND